MNKSAAAPTTVDGPRASDRRTWAGRVLLLLIGGLVFWGLVGTWGDEGVCAKVSEPRGNTEVVHGNIDPGWEAYSSFPIVDQLGGSIGGLAASEGLAYLGVGRRLEIWDRSGGESPRRLGATEPLTEMVKEVLVSEDHAYAIGDHGLHVVDVCHPEQPEPVAELPLDFHVAFAAIDGRRMVLADWDSRIQILDIARPREPTLVGTLEGGQQIESLAFTAGRLYIATPLGLTIYDVSRPAKVAKIGELAIDHLVQPVLAVRDGLAYLIRHRDLLIYDVGDAARPRLVGQMGVDGHYTRAVVSGVNLLLSGDAFDERGVIHVLDVADPASPRRAGVLATDGPYPRMAVDGSTLYGASTAGKVQVFDLGGGAARREVASLNKVGSLALVDEAYQVAVVGKVAYLAGNGSDLTVVDISRPSDPKRLGGLHLEAGITDLAAKDDRVYLATHGGLEVIDVAMPEAPRRLGRMELLVGELSIDLLGERVLVVGPEVGLLVIDVSSPAEPRQLGSLSLEGAQALAVSEDLVYVAGGGGPLWVVDLSDPSRPRLRGGTDDLFAVAGLVVRDGKAYVVGQDAGLWVGDVSDPDHPRELSRMVLPSTTSIALHGDTLIVGHGGSVPYGIVVIDVRDPERPRIIGGVDGILHTRGLVVSEEMAYASVHDGDYALRLLILDLSGGGPPSALGSFQAGLVPLTVAPLDQQLLVGTERGLSVLTRGDPSPGKVVPALEGRAVSAIKVERGLAYVQSLGTVCVLDVNKLFEPKPSACLHVSGDADQGHRSFAVRANRAYLLRSMALEVWDLSTPSSPVKLAEVRHSTPDEQPDPGALALIGDYALVLLDHKRVVEKGTSVPAASGCDAGWQAGASVAGGLPPSASETSAVAPSGSESRSNGPTPGTGPHELRPAAQRLRVEAKLMSFNLADPAAPFKVGEYLLGDYSSDDLVVDGDRAYVTLHGVNGARLVMLDVHQPRSPVALHSVEREQGAVTLAARDGQIHLIYRDTSPEQLWTGRTGHLEPGPEMQLLGGLTDLTFHGDKLLIAARGGGIYVLEDRRFR